MNAALHPLQMPLGTAPESAKPVIIAEALHEKLKVRAAEQGKPMIELTDAKLEELRHPVRLAEFLATVPRERRSPEAAVAQVYVGATLHGWLKVVAATNRLRLYQIVEAKLGEIFEEPQP